MLALGGLLAGSALLAIVLLTPIFRRPNPPRWVTYQLAGELVTVVIVSLLALGIGYMGAGAVEAYRAGFDILQLGLFAATLAAVVVVWRWLNARTSPGAEPVSAHQSHPGPTSMAAGPAMVANDPGKPTPPKRRQPRRAA